ncbi:MAG: SagB/ThcOx family dehydrogenase [Candidatus Rokubacteria bacterium]|nr:SagB/ThcOx family dehydrogenase [Candidatus Rokubacteria bacterium]
MTDSVARRFHDHTAHTPASVRTSGHMLDWDIKPFPFKVYPDVPAMPLPRDVEPVAPDTLAVLGGAAAGEGALTLERLAAVLYYTAGVTRQKTYPGGGDVLFRAAASTGALYQTEVYVAAGDVSGLPPGLYHFCPGDFTLRRLRAGDVRAALAAAAADPGVRTRAATLVLSAIYWRNTWKYQARGYRHLFWDSGTMLANLLAVGDALALRPRLITGFVDADVNALLGLDTMHEAALELVMIGANGDAGAGTGAAPAREPVPSNVTVPLSSSEVDYPALREIHQASMLGTADEVVRWRPGSVQRPDDPRGSVIRLPAPRATAGRGLGETIQHRGSSRRFGRAALALEELATALAAAARAVDVDVDWRDLVDVYLIVNAVDGVPSGAYRYWPDEHGLELLAAGDFRNDSGYLCLEQGLGADAAAVLYFLSPLDAVLAAFGDRGYRLANLAAGLAGGRAYLAAYAQRFGASGLTFYDDLVVNFFRARARDAIFVTALGRAAVPS